MRSFAQRQNQPWRLGSRNIVRSNSSVVRMPEARLQHACACGGGCPKCQALLTDGGAADAGDVGSIPMQADVDAGVPPAKKPAPPPSKTPNAPPPKAPPAPDCKYKITYANEKSLKCDPGLRGAISHFEITKVQASGKGCPATLDGLKLTEEVTSDHGCHPQEPEIGSGCTIHADKAKPLEGRLENCTDNYAVCGDNQAFKFMGCTQNLTQKLSIGGELAETHTITFEIFKRESDPSGKATRK
jgi:hypothetical protein